MKIFPAIDIKDKKCVRLIKGDFDNKTEYRMSPVEQASNYKNHGFRNLHIIDLDGALTGETVNLDIIQEIVKKFDLKIEVGGGVRNIDSIKKYTDAGVEKVIIYNKDLHDKWHDFLLNINWTDKKNGLIEVWINNKKVYESKGKTIGKLIKRKKDGAKMGPSFRFGVYNGKRFEPVKTQVVYYDSFKSGKNCKKTALFHDCKKLPKN